MLFHGVITHHSRPQRQVTDNSLNTSWVNLVLVIIIVIVLSLSLSLSQSLYPPALLSSLPQVAGIFLIGMTNDLIGNRVVGHENGIWTNGAARAHGHGKAAGKVCVMNAPFGVIRGNVNHDCRRFGVYPDNQHPRMLKRDADGYVTDWASCDEFTSDGGDNGVSPANVIEDSFEWHNMFVGAYALGDMQYRNLVSVNNARPRRTSRTAASITSSTPSS